MNNVEVLYFTAPWCAPCKAFGPALEAWAADNPVTLTRLNVEEEPDKVREFEVQSLPTLVWLFNGEPFARLVGPKTAQQLDATLRLALD